MRRFRISRRLVVWTLCATGWWLAYAWFSAQNYLTTTSEWGLHSDRSEVMLAELVSAGLWIPLTVLALWLSSRFPLGRPFPTALPVHLAALAVAVFGRIYVVRELDEWLGCYPALPPASELVLTNGQLHAFTYLLLTGVGHALHYASQHRRREADLARAQVAALRAQMRPHFLFNALNTIAAVVPEDPARAERMIVSLGTLLRRSLERGEAHQVPLRTELELARCYLEIEQARYGDRVRASFDVNPEVADALVPPLVVQPLVENAVRHGLVPRAEGGHVRISAKRRGDRLRLVVADDGVGLPAGDRPAEGIGLGNTRSRLRAGYGSRHRFTVAPRPGGGVEVTVEVPLRRSVVRVPVGVP